LNLKRNKSKRSNSSRFRNKDKKPWKVKKQLFKGMMDLKIRNRREELN
jgi:hypothetical protein